MGGREDFPQRSADRRSSGREGDRGWRWRDLFRAGPARHHRACYLAVEKEFTQAARRAALLTLHPGGLKKCYLCCRIKVLPMSPVAHSPFSVPSATTSRAGRLPALVVVALAAPRSARPRRASRRGRAVRGGGRGGVQRRACVVSPLRSGVLVFGAKPEPLFGFQVILEQRREIVDRLDGGIGVAD